MGKMIGGVDAVGRFDFLYWTDQILRSASF